MNQIKNKEEEQIPEEKVPYIKDKTSSRNFVTLLFSTEWMSKEKAIELLPFFVFLGFIGMFYIGNKHFAEKNIREVEKLNKELKELRYEYMTTKAELMFRSKQTEVVKQTELIGIKESIVPPVKIVVDKK
jgi:hypothetical protein